MELGVPESTARGWLRSAGGGVVSLPTSSDRTVEGLLQTIEILRARNERLVSILRIIVVLLKVYF